MSKKVHLIANAHIDPIWQWEWEEGASCALSTFQSAANLLKEFDYVFNHNEVTLYKYTEKYAPELYGEIQKYVKEGKWNIIGGWYLQPDCLMPSGEGIVRQIQTGKEYFSSHFGQTSKTAFNVDAFGHSRGLVQIVKKCGQENYFFVRPFNWFLDPSKYQLELPDEEFIWEGYDGSRIKAFRCGGYGSGLGYSLEKISKDIKNLEKYDVIAVPWGVGNHGGGPSRKDLSDIKRYQEENKDIEIVHSTVDKFFDEINPTSVWSKSLIPCMAGCYTSMVNLKQKYRQLEKELFFTEKICSVAEINGACKYPVKKIKEATEDMLNVQFHDVLAGTTVKAGEDNAIDFIGHAMHLLNEARADAYFGLIKGEKPAEPDTYPFLAFNPKPYECEQLVECEACFLMDNHFDNKNCAIIDIYDEQNNLVTSQTIKEESNIYYQWRKRIVFKYKLKPLSITRFTAKYHVMPKEDLNRKTNEDIYFKNDVKEIKISSKTGLLELFKINGKEISHGSLFQIFAYEDYEDPWGMDYKHVGWNPKPMVFSKKPNGMFSKLKSLEVIEDGEIYLGVETFFEYENTKAHILYKIYKEGTAVDVQVDLFPGDANRTYKMHLPLNGDDFSGEQMFGYESLFNDGKECVAQNYLTLKNNDKYLQLITPSTFGSSYSDNTIKVTLLRTATYCAHPTYIGPLVQENIYLKKIDSQKTTFNFRLVEANENELKRNADLFIEKPYCLNVFPTIDKKLNKGIAIKSSSDAVNLVTIKKADQTEGYIIRLQNNSSCDGVKTKFSIGEKSINLEFGKYEVKTLVFNGELKEIFEMLI